MELLFVNNSYNTDICIHTHMRCIDMCVHMYTDTCTLTHIHVDGQTHTHTDAHTHIHIIHTRCTYAFITHTHIQTCTLSHTYQCTYTHIHACNNVDTEVKFYWLVYTQPLSLSLLQKLINRSLSS